MNIEEESSASSRAVCLSLDELDAVEGNIFELFDITKDTLKELLEVPECNLEVLSELAGKFANLLEDVRVKLKTLSQQSEDYAQMGGKLMKYKEIEKGES